MTEVWRDIPGYEGRYAVSDQGRVRNAVTGRVLKPAQLRSGHTSVDLLGRWRPVHWCVLTAFEGLRPHDMEARHLNGVPGDNRLDNLVWATRRRNTQDRKWHDMPANQKLRPCDVRTIRQMIAEGKTQRAIAKLFGVHRNTVCNINRGLVHADV